MPKETEADRILRKHKEQKEEEWRLRSEQSSQELVRERLRRVEQLEKEIPVVLDLLKKRNYPGMEEVSRHDWEPRINLPYLDDFFGMREYSWVKAGWLLDTLQSDVPGLREPLEVTMYIHLLSDGRLIVSGESHSVTPAHLKWRTYYPYNEPIASSALEGLRQPRAKLEKGEL